MHLLGVPIKDTIARIFDKLFVFFDIEKLVIVNKKEKYKCGIDKENRFIYMVANYNNCKEVIINYKNWHFAGLTKEESNHTLDEMKGMAHAILKYKKVDFRYVYVSPSTHNDIVFSELLKMYESGDFEIL